jgi:hypothetical protein
MRLAVLSVALGTSACTPDREGAVGITRSPEGHLVAVVAGCGTEFKQLHADNALPQTLTSFASWKLPKETGATVDLDLERADDTSRQPQQLTFHDSSRYSLYASLKTSVITDGSISRRRTSRLGPPTLSYTRDATTRTNRSSNVATERSSPLQSARSDEP